MRKIILASRSKARKKLLRQICLKFSVSESSVKEDRVLRGRCSDLVMRNASKKAKDVANKFGSGVVIAADTVVLAGKKIVGKPQSLKEALATLKSLSRKPQWVYTGLAVVDIDNNRLFVDYEKTKVCMRALSDSEMRRYFKKVSPLDKAGSFDIQGLGGAFIDRIEGCFYNVVGLPLSKLVKMLGRAGVAIL